MTEPIEASRKQYFANSTNVFTVMGVTVLRSGDRAWPTLQVTAITARHSREATFLAAYNAALHLWPVSYKEIDIPSRFGTTHVVVSGANDAPPLVLLHGYMATSVMWAPNIAEFSRDYRVFAIDVMGQPSKSVPNEPIRNVAAYVAWLTATLDALNLDDICLVGMSFGGWLALT